LEIEKVVDTTGCGDAFQAKFTAEYYVSGDIAAALLCGAVSGRNTAAQIGGIEGDINDIRIGIDPGY
jgi:sugar/nucleoside kinase (ribokinase family)